MNKVKKRMLLLASISAGVLVYLFSQYHRDIKKAYKKLESYDTQSIDTSFGEMTYVESGQPDGTPVILIHGIFGGYDQGMTALDSLLPNEYRKIAPSRFGYPGTYSPQNPTPINQAAQIIELMDSINVEKTYVIATSAGGPSAYKLALTYPDRIRGIVLLSTDAPVEKKTEKELEIERTGPPEFLINDSVMWLTTKYFSTILQKMFGGENTAEDIMATILPVAERKQGVLVDSNITNKDLSLNYAEYPVEEISVPILVLAAKDDPMVDYKHAENLISRIQPEHIIYETGGHLLEGSDAGERIYEFLQHTEKI